MNDSTLPSEGLEDMSFIQAMGETFDFNPDHTSETTATEQPVDVPTRLAQGFPSTSPSEFVPKSSMMGKTKYVYQSANRQSAHFVSLVGGYMVQLEPVISFQLTKDDEWQLDTGCQWTILRDGSVVNLPYKRTIGLTNSLIITDKLRPQEWLMERIMHPSRAQEVMRSGVGRAITERRPDEAADMWSNFVLDKLDEDFQQGNGVIMTRQSFAADRSVSSELQFFYE